VSERTRIIALNDELRRTFGGGRVRMMPSIYDLDPRLCGRALCVMSRYGKFDDDSDHDCGHFVFAGYLFQWHIEYWDKSGLGISSDPADPHRTFRLLTLRVLDDRLIPDATGAVRQHPATSPSTWLR
jgi:hypothetical protein